MLAGEKPYVGKAKVHRAAKSKTLPGFAPRWSEHVRELQKHMSSRSHVSNERRRYNVLKHDQATSCLNFLIIHQCDANLINAREALAIKLMHPASNGNELKHSSEICR